VSDRRSTPDDIDDALGQLRRAVQEVATTHDGMMDAFAEEADGRQRLLLTVCEIIAPALPAISEGNRKILVADGPPVEAPVVELTARGGVSYYLTAQGSTYRLCRSHEHDKRVLVPLGPKERLPRKFRLDVAVSRLGERLRSALHGGAVDRRAEARRVADRLNAVAVLLADH